MFSLRFLVDIKSILIKKSIPTCQNTKDAKPNTIFAALKNGYKKVLCSITSQ